MKEYISTHKHLREVALAQLGEMKPGTTYVLFMKQASDVSVEKGVANPALMLAMKYRPDMNTAQLIIVGESETINVKMERPSMEVVYQIADFEWDDFVGSIQTYFVKNPTVWVVDGDQFTAPI